MDAEVLWIKMFPFRLNLPRLAAPEQATTLVDSVRGDSSRLAAPEQATTLVGAGGIFGVANIPPNTPPCGMPNSDWTAPERCSVSAPSAPGS
jgi:hypothetical protein